MSLSSTSVGLPKSAEKNQKMKSEKAPSKNSRSPPSMIRDAGTILNTTKRRCDLNASAPQPSKVGKFINFSFPSTEKSKSENTYSFTRICNDLDTRFKLLNEQFAAFDKKFGNDTRGTAAITYGVGNTRDEAHVEPTHAVAAFRSQVEATPDFPGVNIVRGGPSNPATKQQIGVLHKGKGKIVLCDSSDERDKVLRVVVRSKDSNNPSHRFLLEPTTHLTFIYREFGHYLDTKPTNIIIQKDGKTLRAQDTAMAAGIKNGDVLQVVGTVPNFNTDTRFKQLIIHQLKDENPATLRMLLSPSQTVADIYRAWSSFTGYEDNTYSLIYNEFPLLNGNKTIQKAGLKNGGNIHCVRTSAATTFSSSETTSGSKSKTI